MSERYPATPEARPRNEKYPGGIAARKARLEREGFAMPLRGNRTFVAEFDKHLAKLENNRPSRGFRRHQHG